MTKGQKIKLHTAMLSDNEHRCNSLNNYIHTDEYLTAEVVKVVEEIVAESTKELQEKSDCGYQTRRYFQSTNNSNFIHLFFDPWTNL